MKRTLDNRLFFEQVEAMLAEGLEVQIPMRGNSMRPLLRDGRDTAVVARCPDTYSPGRGDVVLFRSGGRHILHRIRRRDGELFTLSGDGNYRLEEHCVAADIRAVLVRVIRPSGRVVECASRRWRWQSQLWLALPAFVRRYALAVPQQIAYRWSSFMQDRGLIRKV